MGDGVRERGDPGWLHPGVKLPGCTHGPESLNQRETAARWLRLPPSQRKPRLTYLARILNTLSCGFRSISL